MQVFRVKNTRNKRRQWLYFCNRSLFTYLLLYGMLPKTMVFTQNTSTYQDINPAPAFLWPTLPHLKIVTS